MPEFRDNFFVLTGASGSGKSSIIAALKARGHICVEEIGRQVLREQMALGSDSTPWQNQAKFMQLLLSRSIQAFESIKERSLPVFFDRSIPEGAGYARHLEGAAGEPFFRAAVNFRYNPMVFVTPPWREIYETDEERRYTFEESVNGHQAEAAAYLELGYSLVEVPKGSIETRVEFILERVRSVWPGPSIGGTQDGVRQVKR